MQLLEYHFSPQLPGAPLPEPAWAQQIDRWYQLDEASFALCDALYHWHSKGLIQSFQHLIFVSVSGSNLSDAEFASSISKTGAGSPSKFVYTLPNIPSSLACQLLQWQGPVLCLCPSASEIKDFKPSAEIIKLAQDQALRKAQNVLLLQSNPLLNPSGFRVVTGAFIIGRP